MQYATGYFGIPGTERVTKVHVVDTDTQKPLCRHRPSMLYAFLWCAHGFERDYVTCATCLKRVQHIQKTAEKKSRHTRAPLTRSQRAAALSTARDQVVKAACAWVNFEDAGSVRDLHREGTLRQVLVAAVTKLETLEKK